MQEQHTPPLRDKSVCRHSPEITTQEGKHPGLHLYGHGALQTPSVRPCPSSWGGPAELGRCSVLENHVSGCVVPPKQGNAWGGRTD